MRRRERRERGAFLTHPRKGYILGPSMGSNSGLFSRYWGTCIQTRRHLFCRYRRKLGAGEEKGVQPLSRRGWAWGQSGDTVSPVSESKS